MAMEGRTYLFMNPETFTPSVPQYVGVDITNLAAPMADASKSEVPAAPVRYVGTYPVMEEDERVLAWASPCDLMAQGAMQHPW